MLVLPAERIRELVPMADAITAVREGFTALARGDVEQPQRLSTEDGRALVMLARRHSLDGTVVKIARVLPEKRQLGRPSVSATVVWFDDAADREVLLEGSSLTSLRTGAATGVATHLLAEPDAHVLGMIGSGGQAVDQIRAVCHVRNIREVRIFSRNRTACNRLAESLALAAPTVQFVAASSIAKALDGADIVCCATTAKSPLFAADQVGDHVHINAIGAYRRDMCELPAALFSNASVVAVDQLAAALAEAGDVVRAIEKGAIAPGEIVEIGYLLALSSVPERSGITIFKSVGLGVQDWVIARLAVERALERRPTTEIELSELVVGRIKW